MTGPEHASRPPTRTLADLVVVRRPAGVPYEAGDDYDARALLLANGYPAEPETLIGLLDLDLGVLQAAAARTLGAQQEQTALNALERLAHNVGVEETVRVQAAYALARMGSLSARDLLAQWLTLPIAASPAPLQAAGVLARLGDPRGYAIVRAGLESPNRVIAMIACKQLYFFTAWEGRSVPEGGRVDVFDAYQRALTRPEPAIAGEARAQLAALGTEPARALLAAHPPQDR